MKINPKVASSINVVSREQTGSGAKKPSDSSSNDPGVVDIVSVENVQAARSRVETVEEAQNILSHVTGNMKDVSQELFSLNQYRISQLIS
ncbi:MAG TPA: hypothetical protein ENN34_02385 [Deltaproteobacteria bacterium]|nr:hypothetical protein [Deltaproteobacteria bacterium]